MNVSQNPASALREMRQIVLHAQGLTGAATRRRARYVPYGLHVHEQRDVDDKREQHEERGEEGRRARKEPVLAARDQCEHERDGGDARGWKRAQLARAVERRRRTDRRDGEAARPGRHDCGDAFLRHEDRLIAMSWCELSGREGHE